MIRRIAATAESGLAPLCKGIDHGGRQEKRGAMGT